METTFATIASRFSLISLISSIDTTYLDNVFCYLHSDIWNRWWIRNLCKGYNGLYIVECTFTSLQQHDLHVGIWLWIALPFLPCHVCAFACVCIWKQWNTHNFVLLVCSIIFSFWLVLHCIFVVLFCLLLWLVTFTN